MKNIAGQNSTSSLNRLSQTGTKFTAFVGGLYKQAKNHLSKNWVIYFFGSFGLIVAFIVSRLFIGGLLMLFGLQENYTKLDERTNNSSLQQQINTLTCKNNILVDCYGKCTFRQVVEKQHACEPTK